MLVHVSSKKLCLYRRQHLFESTQNKQQYGTKITCTEVRGKFFTVIRSMIEFFCVCVCV